MMASVASAQALSAKVAIKSQRTARKQVVVKAQQEEAQTRRAAFGVIAGAVLSLALVAEPAAAVSAPKNPTVATSEGYNMEGTKKQGISAGRKKAILAKLKKAAGKQ